jgi:hypothetical protein
MTEYVAAYGVLWSTTVRLSLDRSARARRGPGWCPRLPGSAGAGGITQGQAAIFGVRLLGRYQYVGLGAPRPCGSIRQMRFG